MICRYSLLLLAPLLFMTGCGTTPPAAFYTLAATSNPASVAAAPPSLGILLAAFPEELDRPQLMLRAGDNRLEIQELHRWAGSLRGQFLRTLGEDLVRLTGSPRIVPSPWESGFSPDRRLHLALLRFDGRPAGTARLEARWSLSDASGRMLTLRVSTLEEPAGPNIEALVAAQSRLIGRLAAEIAAAMP